MWTEELESKILDILPGDSWDWVIFIQDNYISISTEHHQDITFTHLKSLSDLLETTKINMYNDTGISTEYTFEPARFFINIEK